MSGTLGPAALFPAQAVEPKPCIEGDVKVNVSPPKNGS